MNTGTTTDIFDWPVFMRAKFKIRSRTVFYLIMPPVFSLCQLAEAQGVRTGADDTASYLPSLRGKRVALIANHTSLLSDSTHLLTFLLAKKIDIRAVWAPEHGFWGVEAAGVAFPDTIAGEVPVISIYRYRDTLPSRLTDSIDIIVFDLQDVGVRCYTYLTVLYQAVELCARTGTPLVVLDRPNPAGRRVDGPLLREEWRSYVGAVPVPLLHGMTMGELACMMVGEKWVQGQCSLKVVRCRGWDTSRPYMPRVAPSPNLRTLRAILLYPTLVLLEGTALSVGRGSEKPFEVACHGMLPGRCVEVEGQQCCGAHFGHVPVDSLYPAQLHMEWLVELYRSFPDKEKFFNSYFEKLAGDTLTRYLIERLAPPEAFRAVWEPALEEFRRRRRPYLLY